MIAGTVCSLRPYAADDGPRLVAVANDPAVSRWLLPTFPDPYTAADAYGWLACATTERPTNNFAIVVEGALAGGIGIRPHREEDGVAVFGYWLGRAFWGRGIATEAARLMAGYAFSERALRRLEATVAAPNTASMRVLEKCGFVREGFMRQALTARDGSVVDAYLYALLRSDHLS